MKTVKRKSGSRKKKRKSSKSSPRHSFKDFLRLLPFAVPLIITAFIYAWQYTRMNIIGLPIEDLRAKKQNLIKQNDSIRLRIEQLQAPARIESIAREKLGMISSEKWQVVALDEPLQPPEVAVEPSRQSQQKILSSRKSTALFGFPEKRGISGNPSEEHSPPDPAEHSG